MGFLRSAMSLAIAGCAVLAGCAVDNPGAACEPLADGVRAVASGANGARSSDEVSLVELWRAGGLNDGEDLAMPFGFSASRTGHLAIADVMLSELIVIGPAGEWLGQWARRGAGPGELLMPVATAWDDDDTLAVFDVEKASVVFLRDGVPTRDDQPVDPALIAPLAAAGEMEWAGLLADGTAFVHNAVAAPGPDGRAVRAILRSLPGSEAPDTVSAAAVPVVGAGRFTGRTLPGWPQPLIGLAGRRMAIGATDGSYRVLVHGRDGMPAHQVCHGVAGVPVSAAERGAGLPHEDWSAPLVEPFANAPAPDRPAPFGRIIVDADGGLLVQRERPNAFVMHDALYGVAGATYDMFGADGTHRGTVQAPRQARIQAAAGDRVWAVEFGEFDEAWIVAYRIEG